MNVGLAAVCLYFAWKSILDEKEELNLNVHQTRQAEAKMWQGNHVEVW